MKALLVSFSLLLPALLWAADPPYTIVLRTANERLWQRTICGVRPSSVGSGRHFTRAMTLLETVSAS